MPELTYFLLTRKLFDSPIWHGDIHELKLFLYLVGSARHSKKPKRLPKVTIKRGELVRSLQQISEDLEYVKRNRVMNLTRPRLSRLLHHLEDKGYIKLLPDTYGTHIKICNYDYYQDTNTYKTGAVLQQRNSSVTVVQTYNNDKNDNKRTICRVIEYLNQQADKSFSDKTKNTQGHIKARMAEGHTEDDFKRVIDNKVASWKNHKKYNSFLRPETLFCPKHFESYLNEKPKKINQPSVSETTRQNIAVLDGWEKGDEKKE